MTRIARLVLPCLFGALFLLTGPVAALALLPQPVVGQPAIVVGPSAYQNVIEAGGRVIGPVRAPIAVFAYFDDAAASARGADLAWFFRDGTALSTVCATFMGVFE